MDILTWRKSHKLHNRRGWKLSTCQGYCTQWRNTSPNGGFQLKLTFAFFQIRPVYMSSSMEILPCKCSVGTRCVQWASVVWNPLKTCSPLWISMMWYKKALFPPYGEKQHWLILGKLPPNSNLKIDRKEEDWSFLLAKYTLLTEWTTAPMVVFIEKKAFPLSL